MANTLTAGDLRKVLVTQGGRWSIDPNLKDNDPIRRYSLGGDLTKAIKVTDVPRIDVTAHFKLPTANPFLQQLRASRGYLSAVSAPMAGGPSAGAGGAVDWRNRFGWPWIAKIKDQGPCESCWVFSAVGLVEAMTRIEHAVWSLRSEGDVHDGLGRQCGDTGWPTIALDWMKTNGVADPACWPYETSNEPYHPTPDRPGRIKLGDYVTLSNVADQKAWIDNVGPLSACFTVYTTSSVTAPACTRRIRPPALPADIASSSSVTTTRSRRGSFATPGVPDGGCRATAGSDTVKPTSTTTPSSASKYRTSTRIRGRSAASTTAA